MVRALAGDAPLDFRLLWCGDCEKLYRDQRLRNYQSGSRSLCRCGGWLREAGAALRKCWRRAGRAVHIAHAVMRTVAAAAGRQRSFRILAERQRRRDGG